MVEKKPIYVLSLAGGGIRGVITAQFLKRLEERMGSTFHGKCKGPKVRSPIVDKFDMFAGNSIGSLIIGSLTYTNMSASELSDNVFTVENSQKIMNKSWWDRIFGRIQSRPYYDGKGKTEVIEKYVGEKTLVETDKKVMFVSYNIDTNEPKFFKSWDERDKDIKVKDATDSSSAAPCFFPSVKINDGWYVDGGICANYPTDCIYADALNVFGRDADIRVLCIGTGYPKIRDVGKRSEYWGFLPWLTKGDLLTMFMDSVERTTNYRMNIYTEALGHKFLRVNDYIENSTIDDVSPENIANLKKTGDDWWDMYGDEVLEFLDK